MKPINYFDLETTGTDVVEDRIVQIAVKRSTDPLKKMLINPGRPIPPGATKVHGITDEMVADAPPFSRIAKSLFDYLKDGDLGGYNIRDFDVPLLSEEFARCGITWPEPGTLIVDGHKIFTAKEKRDLASAALFYLGRPHENAHDAGSDIEITMEIIEAQVDRYEDLRAMNRQEIHEFCVGKNAVDLAGKIVLNEEGVPVFSFGKHKDEPVATNIGFANWMLKSSFATDTKNIVKKIINGKDWKMP